MTPEAIVTSSASHPFVGRGVESDRIRGLIDQTAGGVGAVMMIEGEPGIGKTALLDAAEAMVRARGMRLLRGSATELERSLTFAAIGRCMAGIALSHRCPWRPALAEAEPPGPALSGQDSSEHEFALIETFLSMIDRLCADVPTVVMLDDLHWADPTSIVALGRLGPLTGQLPLLVIVASRPVARATDVAGLLNQFDRDSAYRIVLGPLDDPAVAALTEHVAGARAGPGLSAVVRSAAGNPLYLLELVAGLVDAKAITISADIADIAATTDRPLQPPATLADAIIRRLDFLPDDVRRILTMAAALGPEIDLTELAQVLRAPLPELRQAADLALRAGLLATGPRLSFRHSLIHAVLANLVPDNTRSVLHARAAHFLIDNNGEPDRIAYHLVAAGMPLDRRVVRWLTGAADNLVVRDPRTAVTLLASAQACDLDSTTRETLRLHRIRALLWTGRAAEAEAAARIAVAATATREQQPGGHVPQWLLALACHGQGHLADAIAVLTDALTEPNLEIRDQARYHGFIAVTHCLLEDFAAAKAAATTSLDLARRCGDLVAIGYGCTALGSVYLTASHLDLEQALRLGDETLQAHETGARTGNLTEQFDPYLLRVHSLIELDRLSEAEETLTAAIAFGHDNHSLYLGAYLMARARLLFLAGRWDDALAEIDTLRDSPDSLGYNLPAQTLAALITVRTGAAIHPHTIPEPDTRPGSRGYLHLRPWACAVSEEAQARPNAGVALFVNTFSPTSGGLVATIRHDAYPDIARMAGTINNHSVTTALADAANAIAKQQPTPSRLATASLCRGIAKADPVLLTQAADQYRLATRPHYEAQAHESLAVTLAESGHERTAREAMDTAIDIYTRLGADTDITRILARMRAHGIRRGQRGPRSRPKTGWEALTPTEMRVAAFVAQSMSNTEIAIHMRLSRRTVETHVSHILTKLGLHSRIHIAIAHNDATNEQT